MAEPGLVRRRDLHPNAQRLPVPPRDHGLFSRKVLAWRLSNTMDADFCVKALEGRSPASASPRIFNTDQGSQFTSFAFTNTLKNADIRISKTLCYFMAQHICDRAATQHDNVRKSSDMLLRDASCTVHCQTVVSSNDFS